MCRPGSCQKCERKDRILTSLPPRRHRAASPFPTNRPTDHQCLIHLDFSSIAWHLDDDVCERTNEAVQYVLCFLNPNSGNILQMELFVNGWIFCKWRKEDNKKKEKVVGDKSSGWRPASLPDNLSKQHLSGFPH